MGIVAVSYLAIRSERRSAQHIPLLQLHRRLFIDHTSASLTAFLVGDCSSDRNIWPRVHARIRIPGHHILRRIPRRSGRMDQAKGLRNQSQDPELVSCGSRILGQGRQPLTRHGAPAAWACIPDDRRAFCPGGPGRTCRPIADL